MRKALHLRAIRSVLAFATMSVVGGGCIAVYSFDREPPVACKDAKDCPGSDACGQKLCENGICKLSNLAPVGALTLNNKPGNCQRFVCDGNGNEIIAIDDTNVRVDGDNCTDDVCTNGKPSNVQSPEGAQCGTVPTVTCSANGVCQGCTAPSDCGEDTKCIRWSCEASVCIKNLEVVGTVADDPVPGDCKKNLCNAIGEAPETFAADDAPSDDDACTVDYCLPSGEIAHDLASEGTSCGDCFACAADGLCKPCDGATSDCHEGACVPKPQTCMNDSECASTYCVDGFCCDSECSSTCMACSQAKTGILSGLCAPVKNGEDPDNECSSPAADTCLNGNCSCENGAQDGNETGTDCGGSCNPCTGTWNCGGDTVCDGNVTATCCEQVFELCFACVDQSQMCKNLHGTTCVLGAKNQRFTFGLVGKGNCIPTFNACKFVDCKCQ